ncbi:uncharacterized protein VNE69_05003 [Vairimorpha necatrix]|uniref:Uncharacterized protein n=1 Tax=Vairimorpha necatrix TaxID=6039 RepID=A0AAX4JC11_9MICR
MIVLTLISSLVFSKAGQYLYNELKTNIIKKIENRDYVLFDRSKLYMSVFISTGHYNIRNEGVPLEVIIFSGINYNDEKKFTINCKNKSIDNIVAELEEKIQRVISFPNDKTLVLFYSEHQLNNIIRLDGSITMKNFIESIKKINVQRKENKKAWEIFYDNICMESDYFDEIIDEIYKNNHDVDGFIKHYDYLRNYFIFRIDIGNILYIFRICIDEFDYLNNIKIRIENKYDEEILKKLLDLYNLSYNHLFIINFHDIPINITPNSIEIRSENIFFKIEIESDKIIFEQNAGKYIYSLQNSNNFNVFIDEQCFIEFRKIIEVASMITDENTIKAILMFGKLLRHENKIFFLLDMILNMQRSALNILLGHLLLHYKIIDEPELKIIISNDEYRDVRTTELIDIICTKMLNSGNTVFFILTIGLLIETEKYIAEYDIDDDPFYKTLLHIGNIIKSKDYKNGVEIACTEKSINIMEIMKELVSIHVTNFNLYKNKVLSSMGQLISTFTGLKTNYIDYSDRIYLQIIKLEDVIQCFELNNNEIYKIFIIIKNKLIENSQEDIKFEIKRKNKENEFREMVYLLRKFPLGIELSQIKLEALNSNTIKLFDKDLINKKSIDLINAGIEIIENIFSKKIISDNINEYLINEYKEELIESFSKEVKDNIIKNIKKNFRNCLPNALQELLDIEIEAKTNLKTEYENYLQNIIKILHEKYLINFLNSVYGMILHNSLTKTLEIN